MAKSSSNNSGPARSLPGRSPSLQRHIDSTVKGSAPASLPQGRTPHLQQLIDQANAPGVHKPEPPSAA